ncbi:MAG: hypothetical protein JSU65_01510 [Candidatus Zixiibacteriota bacterium]|nr:MAG: hypothetical protein JSU65_01510 [candidate division Zixibacteria bacterium]
MKLFFSRLMPGLLIVALLAAAGCSDSDDTDGDGFVSRVIDSVALAVAENLQETVLVEETEAEALVVAAVHEYDPTVRAISDIFIDNDVIYATADGALIVYDHSSKSDRILRSEEPLKAVEKHLGDIYVGGDNLFRLEGDSLVTVDGGMVGTINTLYSYGPNLMIGTTFGLYSKTVLGFFLLVDEMDITALVADERGLWVGTGGQGLYRYDGEEFHPRYLNRDRSLFEYVNCLDFNHDHLYLGTPNGLYIFDGGRWEELTTAEGLPSDDVRSIDASRWLVSIGTPSGTVSWFNGEFYPVDRIGEQPVEVVRAMERRIIVGTPDGALVMKSGPVVKTLVQMTPPGEQELAAKTSF